MRVSVVLTSLSLAAAQELAQERPVITSGRAVLPPYTAPGITVQPFTSDKSVRPASTAPPQTFPALTIDGPMTVLSGETLCTQSATVYLFDDKGRDEMPIDGYGTIQRGGVTVLGGKLLLPSTSSSTSMSTSASASTSTSTSATSVATVSARPYSNATYANGTTSSADPSAHINPVQTGSASAQGDRSAAARDCVGFGLVALLAVGAGAFASL